MAPDDGRSDRERAQAHAVEAERLLRRTWISSHVKAQAHATLAVYYSARRTDADG